MINYYGFVEVKRDSQGKKLGCLAWEGICETQEHMGSSSRRGKGNLLRKMGSLMKRGGVLWVMGGPPGGLGMGTGGVHKGDGHGEPG